MKLILLLVLLFLLGCVKPKSERNMTFNMKPDELEVLQAHCEEINSQGDILNLLKEINKDIQEVLDILENPGYGSRSTLTSLAERISENSQKVRLLSRVEWTSERWDHEIVWLIDDQDFKNTIGFSILSAKVESIYLMGQAKPSLLEKVTFGQQGNQILIKYTGIGSSLELCQLQKTFLLVLDVYARNLNQRKHHFFNLYVR